MVRETHNAVTEHSSLNRRRLLQVLGATGIVATAGCLGDDDTDDDDTGDDGDDDTGDEINPWENEKFRRGVTRLIPRDAVIEQIFGGHATALGGPISPGLGAFWDADHEQQLLDDYVGENEEEGLQLLEEAFDELDTEPPVEINFITNVNETRERWMEVIQQRMDETEFIDANLDIQPFDELVAFLVDPDGAAASTDVVGIGWTGGSDPNGHIEQLTHTDTAVPAGFNWNLYSNEEVDQLIDDGQQEMDEDARVGIYHDIQEILAQEVPDAYMWTSDQIDIVDPRIVEDWRPYPNSSSRYWTLYRPSVGQVSSPAGDETDFVASLGANVSTLDPTIVADATSNSAVGTMCYEGLADLDFDLEEFHPNLATDWERVDETTWEFEIREGVQFHNGDEMTPEDVEFSVNRIAGTVNDASVSYVDEMDIDGNTLVVHTEFPYAPTVGDIGSVPILPSGVEGISEEPEEDDFAFDEESIGTGPWILDEFNPEDRTELLPNDDYWYDEGDHPSSPEWDSVTFREVPEQSSQQQAMLNDELHMIDNAAPWELDMWDDEPFEVVTSPAVGFDFVSYPL